MALLIARCGRCGAAYQSFSASAEWDLRMDLAYCPECIDSTKPWESVGVLLPNQPGWTRMVDHGERFASTHQTGRRPPYSGSSEPS